MSERATPASIVRREDLRFDEAVAPLPRPSTPEVDAILGRPIRVLDHGFVRLVDYMGGDGAIVQAARVSYGLGTRKASEDKALIRYLLRNRHTSPFEMVELKLHVKAPIFVARQWLRHRTACLAGDTILAFDDFDGSDLPERGGEGTGGVGEEPSRGITIADFYRLWQEGEEERARHSRTLHPDRIDPGWRYSLPALARLVERDEEHLRGLVAGGRLVAEQDRDGLFVRGSAWQEYARRHAAALSPDREELARLPLRMCDEQTGEIRATRVVDIWQSGVRPVYRVTLANGKSLKMTKDHLCLTERGWLTLGRATGARRHLDGTVTWNPDAPAFAVNGVARPPGAEEVAAPAGVAEQPTDAPGLPGLPGPLVRWLRERALPFVAGKWTAAPEQHQAARPRLYCAFSPVARIEYAGEEMTYDLEVAGPYHNFVANGFVVHNSVNELSARYSILPDELYLPDNTQISFQSTDNKQGRSAAEVDPAVRARVRELLLAGQRSAYATYQELLDAEIARELARIALPVAVYSEWYWKINLHNLFHFLELRTDPHAQFEIRLYGEAICLIAQRVAPVAYEAFENYIRDAIRLSGVERELVTRALRGEDLGPDDWKRLGKRERAEFARKFGLDPDALVPRTAPVTSPDDAPANGHAPEKVVG